MSLSKITISTALKQAFEKIPKTDDRMAAELLLAYALKQERAYLFTHPEQYLTAGEQRTFFLMVKKYDSGWPVAYLTGEKEFYGLKFLVNKNVLIPRPETELMVDAVLALITPNLEHVTVVDVGTGSGCIIISIAKTANSKTQIPKPKQNPTRLPARQASKNQFYGIDISRKALAIAKKNAKLNGLDKKINFLNGDLLEPLIHSLKIVNCKLKIICANLPYLTPTQIKKSPTIKYEPRLALAAGADGLKYYRRLFKQICQLKLQKFILLCEIDPSQKNSIHRLAKDLLPPHSSEIKKDLRGHNRLAVMTSKQ